MTRGWGDGPLLDWVLLNPSIADADLDDPSTRRCLRFARKWGYDGMRVTNLYALRSTDPDQLAVAPDPFGPSNARYLRAARGEVTIVGWGAHRMVAAYQHWSALLARKASFKCLGFNADGSPKHPLYLSYMARLRPWPRP
jgi:hypothetical protein